MLEINTTVRILFRRKKLRRKKIDLLTFQKFLTTVNSLFVVTHHDDRRSPVAKFSG